jgi:leucyl-tRNA synthetase
VFVAPYVLQEYGEGAVMGVPGHDIRDNEFWKLHRPSEPIRIVISPANVHGETTQENRFTALENNVFTDVGVLGPLCGPLQGLSSKEATRKIVSDLASSCGLAEPASNWRIRDWLISRQRYWGTPIPIVHCQHCGAVPVPTEELPVELPKLDGSWFRQRSGNPLESAEDWLKTHCPKCSGPARRDTDTMDTFVDSSWYYMRFVDPHNMLQPFSTEKANSTLPVDIYIGGVEHAILHLLYARFISKFLATTPLWPSGGGIGNRAEPFKRLVTQGMVHGKTYSDPHTGRFLKPNEIDLSNPSKPKMVSTGETPNISWEKMSKSKHNGVDPSQPIKAYGADITRAHMLFQAPIGQVLEWEEDRIVGIQRWFGKLWRIVLQMSSEPSDSSSDPHRAVTQSWDTMTEQEKQLWHLTQKTILSVTHSLSTSLALNTVISDLIKLTNALASPSIKNHNLLFHTTSILLRMLAPVGPAFAEECWERLHIHSKTQSIFDQPFPTPSSLGIQMKTTHQCAVQENGKLRLLVDISIASQELLQANDPVQLQAWAVTQIQSTVEGNRWLLSKAGKDWKRVVVVKGGKTVNFVG